MLHIECVCNTAPAPRARTISTWSSASAEGRPVPGVVNCPAWSISTMPCGGELALRNATGRNHEAKRLAAHDNAEVPAGPEHPAASVEAAADLSQANGDLAEL